MIHGLHFMIKKQKIPIYNQKLIYKKFKLYLLINKNFIKYINSFFLHLKCNPVYHY